MQSDGQQDVNTSAPTLQPCGSGRKSGFAEKNTILLGSELSLINDACIQ